MTIDEFLGGWAPHLSRREKAIMRADLDNLLIAYQTKIDDTIRTGAGIPEDEWEELFKAAKKLDDDIYIHDKVPSLGDFSSRVMDILPRLAHAAAVAKTKLKTSEEKARKTINDLDSKLSNVRDQARQMANMRRCDIAMHAPDMPMQYLQEWEKRLVDDDLRSALHAWFDWPWDYADMMLAQEHAGNKKEK